MFITSTHSQILLLRVCFPALTENCVYVNCLYGNIEKSQTAHKFLRGHTITMS
jgi:hypothetical protein